MITHRAFHKSLIYKDFLAEWTSASAMIHNASSGTDNQILYYEYVISLTHIALSNIIKKHIY
ncbi:hypothetical protein MCEMAEM4_03335 [Burkholderiaceae bacterium]